jgi:hypothetical protein
MAHAEQKSFCVVDEADQTAAFQLIPGLKHSSGAESNRSQAIPPGCTVDLSPEDGKLFYCRQQVWMGGERRMFSRMHCKVF